MATTLRLSREQIAAAMSRRKDGTVDVDIVRQVEALLSLTNLTEFGQSLLSGNVLLDATGIAFAAPLPVGKHFVDLVVMVDVVGGTGADGFTLTNLSTATLAPGFLLESVYDTVAAVMFSAPNNAPAFIFSGTTAQVLVRGFVNVLQAGTVAFGVVRTGAPGSATLLAGSGLACTAAREAP